MKQHLKTPHLVALLAVVVLAMLAWLAFGTSKTATRTPGSTAAMSSENAKGSSHDRPASQPGDTDNGGGNANAGAARGPAKANPSLQAKVEVLSLKIQEVLKRLKTGKVDADSARSLLAELDKALREAGGEAAGAAIIAFLQSGEDAVTGLDFKVGEGGVLEEAPTMRTAMLDKLGQMSAKDAVEYARNIFEQARNADEWAVNMRNLAWNNGDKRFTAELESRLDQMLDRTDWLENPSAGFVEAFDLAVYLGGLKQVANMASVLGLGLNNGLDHAAFLSLDRMTLREPDSVFSYLRQDPSFMSNSPDARAALMARATDSGSAVQRQTIEAYMQNPQTTPEEFRQFAELYPHHSYTLGARLVTPGEQAPDMKQMAQSDLKALDTVRQWMADPRFAARHTELGSVERRLVEYQKQIEQARREGSLK